MIESACSGAKKVYLPSANPNWPESLYRNGGGQNTKFCWKNSAFLSFSLPLQSGPSELHSGNLSLVFCKLLDRSLYISSMKSLKQHSELFHFRSSILRSHPVAEELSGVTAISEGHSGVELKGPTDIRLCRVHKGRIVLLVNVK